MAQKNNVMARRGIAIGATLAVLASAVGVGTLARYTTTVGSNGLDSDGNGARVAEFYFNGTVTKDGTAVSASDLANGISVFSTAYSGTTGRGTANDDANATVKAKDGTTSVVAPGVHGSLAVAMTAGANASHAETDAIVKMDVSQLQSGVFADASSNSTIPLIFGVDTDGDGTDEYYSANLTKGSTYKIADATGLGGSEATKQDVTIAGNLEDLANNTAYYYQANDKFYKLDGTAVTYTVADKANIVTGGEAGTTDVNYTVNWYWAYENFGTDGSLASLNANDAIDTNLAVNAHKALEGTDEEKATAGTTSDIQLAIRATATQVD